MIYAAQWAPVVPVLALLAFWRGAPARFWLVGLGFLASWFAEAVAVVTGGSWVVSYLLPGVQFGLFCAAFGYELLLPGLVMLSVLEVVGTGMHGPEIAVHVVGSALAVWCARGSELLPSVAVYCVAGTALYVYMVSQIGSSGFMAPWAGYQAARVLAFALFLSAAESWHAEQ